MSLVEDARGDRVKLPKETELLVVWVLLLGAWIFLPVAVVGALVVKVYEPYADWNQSMELSFVSRPVYARLVFVDLGVGSASSFVP